jgi:hypothetical protein
MSDQSSYSDSDSDKYRYEGEDEEYIPRGGASWQTGTATKCRRCRNDDKESVR